MSFFYVVDKSASSRPKSRTKTKTPLRVFCFGGDNRARTYDLLHVKQTL